MTTAPQWRKSSYSGTESDCVELADKLDAVRDSKHPQTVLQSAELGAFVRAVKEGRFSR